MPAATTARSLPVAATTINNAGAEEPMPAITTRSMPTATNGTANLSERAIQTKVHKMVCSGCRKPNKQVTLRCESIITSTNQQLNDGLKQLKHKAVAEVFQVPGSNTAFVHFDSVEGASHRPIEINRQIFTVHPTTDKNGDVVRYAHQALSFTPVPVITATTLTMPTSTNSTAEEAADSERNVVLAVESL